MTKSSSGVDVILLAALLESLWCSIEFVIANVVFLQLSLYLFSGALPKLIWHSLIPAALTLLYFSLRYKYLFSLAEYPKWFGLLHPTNLSKITLLAIVFHSIQLATAFLVQQYNNNWIFSLYNITSPKDGSVDWSTVLFSCFLSPFLEEIIFRGIIFYIIYLRIQKISTCLWISNTIFGLIHLSNVGVPTFHSFYIILQVILTPLIGYVLGLRFIATGTLWESIILHSLNNVSAIFVPPKLESYSHPVVISASLASALFYASVYYLSAPPKHLPQFKSGAKKSDKKKQVKKSDKRNAKRSSKRSDESE